MRWWNNSKRSVGEGENGQTPKTNNLHEIASDAKDEQYELPGTSTLPVKGDDEGQRQFSLFRRRRRRTDCDANQDIDKSGLLSKSEQDNNADANTTVAAVMNTAVGQLACQKEGESLLSGSPGTLDRGVHEDSFQDVQSVGSANKSSGDTPTKFNWFGLRRNSQTNISPRQEYEKSCEYASINEKNMIIADEMQSSVDGNDSDAIEADESSEEQLDKTDGGARCINNWFDFLKSTRNEDSIEIHRLLETDQISTDNDIDEDGENCEECSEESCPEADRIPSYGSSMDSGDIILEISDDERLQALFDEKCVAQRSEQEDESEDYEHENYSEVIKEDSDRESASLINVSGDDDIFELWKRRQRLKRKLHIEAPMLSRRDDAASTSINMLGSVQLEAGGGRNEENLRSLELESHLIDSSSNNNGADKKMARMRVMHAEEKEREDMLYEQWLLDIAIIDGQEIEYGYDNKGWYSTLTQQEDGADDLSYINSSTMNVSTEDSKRCDESNQWLDTAGNIALLIFAPDLYFINQSETNTEYHVTQIKEEGEEDAAIEQKDGWFKNLFTKWTGNVE